jgi:hypothetical protein
MMIVLAGADRITNIKGGKNVSQDFYDRKIFQR